jgi:6-phosphogluconolactonase
MMLGSRDKAWAVALAGIVLVGCGGGKGAAAPSGTSAAGTGGSPGTGGATGATGGAGGATGTGGSASPGEPYVYVGGYADVIDVFHLDLTTGALTPVGAPVAAGTSPSFLTFDPAHATLVAVNEAYGGNGAVASFLVDAKTGALSFVSRVSSQGDGPAHVSVDRTGKFALVANYGGGTVAVLPLGAGGQLGAAVDVHDHGANANPHQIFTDHANAFAFVPNKGAGTVTQYAFDAAAGKLTGDGSLATMPGAGPRHIDLHPTAPYAYLIDENASTMSALAYDAATGQLTILQTLTTLPAGYTGANTGAEVKVAPSGKFVYGSNRGNDSIVIFHVEADGKLSLVGHQPTMGQTPRHFDIDPSGRILVVANQMSNSVVTFFVDPSAGTLTPTGTMVSVPSPSFSGVAVLAGP